MSTSLLVNAKQKAFSIKDRENPRSVINIVSPAVATAIFNIPDEHFDLDYEDLARQIEKKGKRWFAVDCKLRTKFWFEYNEAQQDMRNMNMAEVYTGICSANYFYTTILSDKLRLVHMLTPPHDYDITMRTIQDAALDRLAELVSIPIPMEGKLDPKLLAVQLKAIDLVLMRTQGGIVQRVEQKNLNLNVEAPREGSSKSSLTSLGDIDKRLKELEATAQGTRANMPEDIVIQAITVSTDAESPDE